MGFDVTAVSVIFFVALLTSGSAWMGGYWKSSELTQASRVIQEGRADDIVHTNLTITSTNYNLGATRFTIDAKNTGSTVLDVSEMSYLVDGITITSATLASAAVLGHPGSVLLLPGDTLEATFLPISPSPTHFKLVTASGVAGYWG